MPNVVHHQARNTNKLLLTCYRYDARSSMGPPSVPHFHKNYEVLIPMRERTHVFIDGTEYVLRPGEAVMVHPFQIHHLYIPQESYIWCSVFSAQLIGSLHGMLAGHKPKDPVFRPADDIAHFFVKQLTDAFGDRRELRAISSTQKLTAKSCLYAIGGEYLRQVELIPTRRGEEAENLAVRVTRYISEHFKAPTDLRAVAEELGYNYQYLSRNFNDLLGIGFKKLLNQYRMEYALNLLLESKAPITQVAFESGFQSLRSFNRVCFETFQKSPKEIRKNSRA